MKLGTKIALGFGAVLALAITLGAIAVVNMYSVAHKSQGLVTKQVPSVDVANQVERHSLLTMYNIRAYTYTDDDAMLKAGRKYLGEVDANLTEAAKLAKDQGLVDLAGRAKAAQDGVVKYKDQLDETEKINKSLDEIRLEMNKEARDFMEQCNEYLKSQEKAMVQELGGSSPAAAHATSEKPAAGWAKQESDNGQAAVAANKLVERFEKTVGINAVIDLGNEIRIANWRGQATRDMKVLAAVMGNFPKIIEQLKTLRDSTRQEVNLKQLEGIAKSGEGYRKSMQALITAEEKMATVADLRGKAANEVLEAAQQTALAGIKDTSSAAKDASDSLGSASLTVLIGLGIMAAMGLTLAFFITRGITSALTRIVADLAACSNQTAAAADQVAGSSQSLADGTTKNAAALEETSASLEEMSSMVRQTASNTDSAKGLSNEATTAAKKGSLAMDELSKAILDIKNSADQTAKIIKTIDEIAFQTNLLALNAAVEAARAGDAGKGFAVVAEEVRNLAQRAGEAARNTASLIETSVKNAENGVNLSKNAGQILGELATTSGKVNSLVNEIAASAQEQSQGIEQVTKAVRQMDAVTQSNAAEAEEAASVGEELAAQSQTLNQQVVALETLVRGVSTSVVAAGNSTRKSAPAAHAAPKAAAHAAPTGNGHFKSAGKDEAKAAIPFAGERKDEEVLSRF